MYSKENTDLGASFFVINDTGNSKAVDPTDFASELNKRRGGRSEDEPEVIKKINKTENDVFQNFTRTMLSRQFSINDIDVLVKTPRGIATLELKRSSKNPWSPYLDDVPNYLLLRSLSIKLSSAIDFTIHYDQDQPGEIEIHTILSISRDSIPGFSKLISASDANSAISILLDTLKDPNVRPYSSRERIKI